VSAPGRTKGSVVALCGGVGGAKLALGLSRVLDPEQLTVIVNTGDDFEHLGLHISPDLDTVLYTLSGLADGERGWGRAGETWEFMLALDELGGETWFRLGDRDLAIHVLRTQWLRTGKPLSEFAAAAAERLGIPARIVPMSDDPVRTVVHTFEGKLPFQRYFVERRCEPAVVAIEFEGAAVARPAEAAQAALTRPDLAAVIVCPSNPYLSVDPILAVPALRALLRSSSAPVVAVSPIIAGQAVKGPTAKIMAELGVAATPAAIARHYADFLDGLVIDDADAGDAPRLPCAVEIAPTLMRSLEDREGLARRVLCFAARLSTERRHAGEARRRAHG
jgi:LPPG:FO 2-phospho-L-lactate transferase